MTAGPTGPLFKWFGSKWQAARRYPAPRFDRVCEPFAGGAGYSLRHAARRVTIYEENANLAALWAWLIGPATDADVREIPTGLAVGTDIREIGLSAGQAQLLKHWQRTNNYGECWTVSPWGDKPGQWTENTRARVAAEIQYVKHWRFAVPELESETTYFIDPPYLFNYRYGFRDFNHSALAAAVRALPQPAQVIACEAACPKTGAVPDYLPFVPFAETVTSRRKATQSHHSKEYVYVA